LVDSYTFSRKDLAGGETGWHKGGFGTTHIPALGVFRKGEELLVTPNFSRTGRLKEPSFFMSCKSRFLSV
jgi:hypothetical protein